MGERNSRSPRSRRNTCIAETTSAKASLTADLFSVSKLWKKADTLSADYFSNAVLINHGNPQFHRPTPAMGRPSYAATFRDAAVVNANNDSLPDILLMGNFYENSIEMGRNDADFGTILLNHGNGAFTAENINGLQVKGQVRHIGKITIGKIPAFILARNNDSAMVIRFSDQLSSPSRFSDQPSSHSPKK